MFQFGEDLFDGVEVWGIGRQEQKPGPDSPDCGATIRMGSRIASHEMLLNINLLPHLICSFWASGGIGGYEAGEHDDTGRTCGSHSGPIRVERPFGKGPDPRRVRCGNKDAPQARAAPAEARQSTPAIGSSPRTQDL